MVVRCIVGTCTHVPPDPDRWGVAMALYMIGFISYGATLVFYAAVFPRLARNTQHARELREKYEKGEVSAEEYEVEEIVGHRWDKRKRTMTYLVRWVGYSPLYDLWLTARDLRNAPELLLQYRKKHNIP